MEEVTNFVDIFDIKMNNVKFCTLENIDNVSLTKTNRSGIISQLKGNPHIVRYNSLNLYGFDKKEKLLEFILVNIDNIYCYNQVITGSMSNTIYLVYKILINDITAYIKVRNIITIHTAVYYIDIYDNFKALILDEKDKYLPKSIEEVQLKLTGDIWWKNLENKIKIYKCYSNSIFY